MKYSAQRLINESFKDYKIRQRQERADLDITLKGIYVHISKWLSTNDEGEVIWNHSTYCKPTV